MARASPKAAVCSLKGSLGAPHPIQGAGERARSREAAPPSAETDALRLLRSRGYLGLLLIAALLGVPISAIAYGFLALVTHIQHWTFTDLPMLLGFPTEPIWWPIPSLLLAGVLVGLTIRYLPGGGGHSPAGGFKLRGAPAVAELPGVVLAALATLSLGAVLGPEAPLIAIGAGLGALVMRYARRDAPPRAAVVVGGAGSFAAISTLLGSPLLGAFLLMEAAGVGGVMLTVALLPGLLAAGVGTLIFVGLDRWTGLGTFSLAVPNLPHAGSPTIGQFGWAVVVGLAAVPVGLGIRQVSRRLESRVARRRLVLTPIAGLAVACAAIAYALLTGRASSEVLFSGQSALGPFITSGASYPLSAVVVLFACKAVGYSLSASSFRGGLVFPSLFLGAAGGIALSHLPGLPLIDGVAIGMAAMSAVMLRLPMTSVLLPALFLQSDGLYVLPLVIVSVVIAYVASVRFDPDQATDS